MITIEETIKPLMSYLFEDKPLEQDVIEALIDNAADCFDELSDLPDDAVEVELPDTNVGRIFIQKEFAPVASKIDALCDKLYELDDNCAGWEYFSTICALIDCAFEPAE